MIKRLQSYYTSLISLSIIFYVREEYLCVTIKSDNAFVEVSSLRSIQKSSTSLILLWCSAINETSGKGSLLTFVIVAGNRVISSLSYKIIIAFLYTAHIFPVYALALPSFHFLSYMLYTHNVLHFPW